MPLSTYREPPFEGEAPSASWAEAEAPSEITALYLRYLNLYSDLGRGARVEVEAPAASEAEGAGRGARARARERD